MLNTAYAVTVYNVMYFCMIGIVVNLANLVIVLKYFFIKKKKICQCLEINYNDFDMMVSKRLLIILRVLAYLTYAIMNILQYFFAA